MKKPALVIVAGWLSAGAVVAQSAYFQAVTNLNPTAYWPMHETTPPVQGSVETNNGTLGSLGNAYFADWVGNNAVGRQFPGALTNDSNPCLAFSGGRPSYLLVPHTSPATTLVPPFTIECWAYPTNLSFGDIVAQAGATYNGAGNNGNKNGIRLMWQGNNSIAPAFQVFVGDGTQQTDFTTDPNVTPYATNQWYYLVLTCDANTNFNLYVNGFMAASATLPMVPTFWNPLTIGGGWWDTRNFPYRLFRGYVDEVAIYTNALPETDISVHYTAGTNGAAGDYFAAVNSSGPLLYYRMDAPDYTEPGVETWPIMADYGSAAVNGVYRPGLAPTVAGPDNRFGGLASGVGGNAAPCNGLSTFAAAYDPSAFNVPFVSSDPANDTPFTISAWFKGNPHEARIQSVLSHGDSSWYLRQTTYGYMRFNSGGGTGNEINGGQVNDGEWHHVVATHSGNTNTIYIDGLEKDTGNGPQYTNGPGNDLPVMMGAAPDYTNSPVGPGRQFAGSVCEVAFWNGTALSANQVQELYDAAGIGPEIIRQPVSATINQNSPFTNSVTVSGSALVYQWYQNDLPRSGQTSASLILNSAQPSDDSTNWYVVASNTSGAVTSAVVSLTVVTLPTITSQSSTDVVLFAGGQATFSVAASGAEPLHYEWRSNSVAIPGATNPTYTLSNAQLGFAGSFQCVVTNNAGLASSTPVNVTVIAAPTAPYAQAVLADAPQGYWRLNEPDNGLGNGNAGVVAHDFWGGDNGAYTNVSLGQPPYNNITDPADTSPQFGVYSPFTDNYAGWIESVDFAASNASVNFSIEAWVNGAGQSINGAGIVTKGYGGGGEEFCIDYQSAATGIRFFVRDAAGPSHSCSSTVSPDYAWHHVVGVCDEANGLVSLFIDGAMVSATSIAPESGIRTSTGPMTIGARRQNASSSYNNQFFGFVDEVAVYPYALSETQVRQHYTTAGVAPRVTQAPPATAVANEGGVLTLPALALGTPPLTNTWFDSVYGTNVAQTVVMATNKIDGTLVVSNLPAGWNGGALQWKVANAYGSAIASVALMVNSGPPTIVQDLPAKVTTVAGKPYTYFVGATGTMPFTYQWYSNNVLVADQAGSNFTFNAAAGSYRVTVSGPQGTVDSTTSVMTLVPQLTTPYASAILGAGAAGYWPLQETWAPAPATLETNYGTLGALGNAYYASGNLTFGQGGALTDGDTSVATTGANTSYAFVPRKSANLTLQAPLTLECWMQPTGGTGTGDLISQGGSGLNSAANNGDFGGFRMSFGGSAGDGDALQFFAYIGSGGIFNGGNTNIETPPASITRSAWNHCVATYDGTNVLLYVNGQLLAEGTTPFAPDTWTPLTLGGGRWQNQVPTRRFTGGLDEVAVYTNVLTQSQIQNHYTIGTTSGNYAQTVLTENPLLYYRMNCAAFITPDPLSFPPAVNYGSAPANGAYVSGVVPGGVAGPSFVGAASVAAPINGILSCVDAGYDPVFDPAGRQPFTAVVWFKGYPADGRVQTVMGHGQNWALNLDGTTGQIVWNLYDGGQVTSTTILNDGNWHLLAGVSDGTTSSLYVDGMLNNSGPVVADLVSEPRANLFLGGNSDFVTLASNQRYLAGAIAHAAVFTNALTSEQIAQIYTLAALPTISLGVSGNNLIITYTGTLLSSTDVAGNYQPVPGASSPYTVPQSGPQMFYRTSNP